MEDRHGLGWFAMRYVLLYASSIPNKKCFEVGYFFLLFQNIVRYQKLLLSQQLKISLIKHAVGSYHFKVQQNL